MLCPACWNFPPSPWILRWIWCCLRLVFIAFFRFNWFENIKIYITSYPVLRKDLPFWIEQSLAQNRLYHTKNQISLSFLLRSWTKLSQHFLLLLISSQINFLLSLSPLPGWTSLYFLPSGVNPHFFQKLSLMLWHNLCVLCSCEVGVKFST